MMESRSTTPRAPEDGAIFQHLQGSPLDEMAYIHQEKEKGRKVVGIYCEYAPREIILAAGALATCLCAATQDMAVQAEADLPANLCPIIKSIYGFIKTGKCPFFEASDAIVAETTCDGKKKMFEMIMHRRPTFILELTQKPHSESAFQHWLGEVRNMKAFLEETFQVEITDDRIREAIRTLNRWRDRYMGLNEFSRSDPPYIRGSERILVNQRVAASPVESHLLNEVYAELNRRREAGRAVARPGAPRILLTGTPVFLTVRKVFDLIEDCGAVVVVQEACSGVKPMYEKVSEEGDPLEAVARKYFNLPCSCFTPNTERFRLLDRLVDEFKVDAVVDLVWLACHTYNVESFQVRAWARDREKPYLKVETDFSPSDTEQLRTRIESFLEMVES